MRLDPLRRGRGGPVYSRAGSVLADKPSPIGKGHSYGSNARIYSGPRSGAAKVGYDNMGSPATSEAIRPMPRTAKMAVKVRSPLKLSATTPPMPRGKVAKSSSSPSGGLGAKIKSALKSNKGVNQAKALARMKAASRK